MSANCLKCEFLTISHKKNLEIFSKSFWVENECPCYQQYCHSLPVTKTKLFKIAFKFSFEKCTITSTKEGGLKEDPLHDSQLLHALSCSTHWLASGYLQSCYTHPIRQAGGICLWQTVNTATLVTHTSITWSGRGAFASFNTAEVHISGFDCCLDNCTVCYAVTTNQSVLAVTGGLAFENMQSCFTNTSASRGHFL